MQFQFQNGMNLPLMMDNAKEMQPLTWLSNHDNQHTILRDSQNFFSPGLVNAHKLLRNISLASK